MSLDPSSFPMLREILNPDKQPQRKDSFGFISGLIQTFGLRHVEQIKEKLRYDLREIVDRVHRAYFEIQQNLRKEMQFYQAFDFPETQKLLEFFRDEKRADEQFFCDLKKRSYEILPFPQYLLTYPHCDRDILAKIEASRMRAFELLVIDAPINSQWQMDRLQLYYSCGALMNEGGKPIYFHEVIDLYHAKRAGLPYFLPKKFIQTEPNRTIKTRIDGNIDFVTFLINVSIQQIKNNLRLEFPSYMEELLWKLFDNEFIRSDFCFFTVSLEYFYSIDCTALEDRASAAHLLTLQMYIFFNCKYEITEKDQETLFSMMTHRDPSWDISALKGFEDRKLEYGEKERFSWRSFDQLLQEKRRYCWPLFVDLWSHKHAESIISLFLKFDCRDDLAYLFQIYNENRQAALNEYNTLFFVGIYEEILSVVNCKDKEKLLLDPPVQDFASLICNIGNGAASVNRLNKFLEKHQVAIVDKLYISILRQYILHPCGWLICELEKNAASLGIQTFSQELLYEIFARPHEPFPWSPPEKQRASQEQAMKWVHEFRDRFQFTDIQIFLLYLEVVRLAMEDKCQEISDTLNFITRVQKFTPFLRKDDIYFLLIKRPTGQFEGLTKLEAIKENWIKEQSFKFVVSQLCYEKIFDRQLPAYAQALADGDNVFATTFLESMCFSFAPPSQLLCDYFRITKISEEDIRWGRGGWKTHLGQLKWIGKNESVGVYLNWYVFNDFPTLFLSFYDTCSNRTYSNFISLKVNISDIQEDLKRGAFYSFLTDLAWDFFREVVEDLNEESETKERKLISISKMAKCWTFQRLLDRYAKDIAQGNLKIEHIEKMAAFIQEVKISYRQLFLKEIQEIGGENFEKIAAQGHIYSINTLASLLPEEALQNVENVEHFLADPIDVDRATKLFFDKDSAQLDKGEVAPLGEERDGREVKLEFKQLDLDLYTSRGDFPIEYVTQTACELTGETSAQLAKDEAAVSAKDRAGRYVTLRADKVLVPLRYPLEVLQDRARFEQYFKLHDLLLKAAIYRKHETIPLITLDDCEEKTVP